MNNDKLTTRHLGRKAIVYVRQSSQGQVQHNLESQRLQYSMKQKLQSYGWKDVVVIDEDLGLSGASAVERRGFQKMVAEVCVGNVGAIAAREVSRFARNNRDWHQLIEMCAMVGALLIDHEAIYDPRRSNDRLLLGLKGTLSEYELDLLHQRSSEAQWQKAERGELVRIAPTGFIKMPGQRLEKNPDLRVQKAIHRVYDKFFELGSAHQTLMWFLDQGLMLPTVRRNSVEWETWWRKPSYTTISHFLKDPTYAGAYVYGRSKTVTKIVDGVLRKTVTVVPMSEWPVFIRDHHEGYISWDQYERIQSMLRNNMTRPDSSTPGAAKKGCSLLAGLLRCRRCGRPLYVAYSGQKPHVSVRYICRRSRFDNTQAPCISFPGPVAEQAVSQELLRVVEPAAIEAAKRVATEDASEQSDLLDALELDLEAARYASERAWRQYDAIDPDNRLVASELERRWNVALERVQQVEEKIETHKQQTLTQEPPQLDFLIGLASDLQRVWDDPSTDVRLKKRIARTVIEQIVADTDEKTSEIELVLHWKGGVHTVLRVPWRRRGQPTVATDANIVEVIRVLVRVCDDAPIAQLLNRHGASTAKGNRWTKQRVAAVREHRGIPRYDRTTQRDTGWMNLTQAAQHTGVSGTTLRKLVEQGDLIAQHPLSHGPWVFNQTDLDDPVVNNILNRIRTNTSAPSELNREQLELDISTK